MGNKESTHSKTNGKEKEKNQKTEALQSLKRSKEQKCIICKLKVRDAEGERCSNLFSLHTQLKNTMRLEILIKRVKRKGEIGPTCVSSQETLNQSLDSPHSLS